MAQADALEAVETAHRLEIQVRRLTERLDDLEGRHGELSRSVRGRLGGRPPKHQAPGDPLPVGVQHLFPSKE